jgi:hypothetical protein
VSADDLALYRRMQAQYLDAERAGNEREAEVLLDELDKVWLRLTVDERHQLSLDEHEETQA